jgi:hypothetical protein
MNRMLLACLVGLKLLLPAMGRADSATVATTLPDEAAECRHLLTLCQALQDRAQGIQEREAKAGWKGQGEHQKELKTEKALARWNKASSNGHAAPDQVSRRVEKYQKATEEETRAAQQRAHAEFIHNKKVEEYEERLQTANKVAREIRAKHAAMPSCFQDCSDVLNLEEFR